MNEPAKVVLVEAIRVTQAMNAALTPHLMLVINGGHCSMGTYQMQSSHERFS